MEKENKAFKIFRVIITLIAIVFLLLFVSGALWGIVNIGNLVGGLLCVWLIFVLGTRNKYKSLKEKLKKNIFGKIVLYGINFCFTALLCYGLIVTGLMTFACIQQPKQNATAIVLGAQVTENGPSMMLTGRINSAVRYLQENPDAKAVLTGGHGSNKPTDFDLMGSTDGTNWFLIRNFTKDADGLPVTSTGTFTSEIYDAPQPFSQIRMVVNATNTSSIFWTMSEFKFYSVSVTDPEAADE